MNFNQILTAMERGKTVTRPNFDYYISIRSEINNKGKIIKNFYGKYKTQKENENDDPIITLTYDDIIANDWKIVK